MKVLMISGDPLALDPESGVHKRLLLQAAQTDFLTVFVPSKKAVEIALEKKGIVRGFAGSKLGIARAMLKSAKKEKFDIITAQDPFFLGHIAWHMHRRAVRNRRGIRDAGHPRHGCPGLQFQIHADIFSPDFAAQSVLNRLKVRWALFHLRRADCIRVVSQRIKDSLIARGIQAPISVLPIFVDVQKFAAMVHKPHAEKNILWIGRFEEEKDPLQAIAIFADVLKKVPEARLIMLGSGSLKEALMKRADRLPVGFPGWKDPIAYLETADVVLSTSRHESWGASMVEALAGGVPVVAPDVGIAKEAGALVVSRDQLARKIIDVLHSGEKGALQLPLLTAEEWARQWYADLQECCRTF